MHYPSIISMQPRLPNPKTPLLRRLLQSKRYDETEPWPPLEHPSQEPLEEFLCPRHDFAITMDGGNSKICRICEVSEFEEQDMKEWGLYTLIADLCPPSQTVIPLLTKIHASEFTADSQSQFRYQARYRDRRRSTLGSHNPRNCDCKYCTQDRTKFRSLIEPLLTREESLILDVCDRMEPHITQALKRASRRNDDNPSPSG